MTVGTPNAIVDGRPAHQSAFARLRRHGQRLMISRAEQDEAELDQRLLAHPGVTRANTVAVMSPAGGVGKTALAFVVANLLTTHLRLRVVAVDGSPEFGTLAHLVPDDRRAQRGLNELLDGAHRVHTATDLNPYLSRTATGLHVLSARHDPDRAPAGPDRYGELVALLSCFYEVVLLDLGTGVVGPLPRFGVRRADQAVFVTTPSRLTIAFDALTQLRRYDRVSVTINQSRLGITETRSVEDRFRPYAAVTIPDDQQLEPMLSSHTYTLGALPPRTRTAIKRLGLVVAEQLV